MPHAITREPAPRVRFPAAGPRSRPVPMACAGSVLLELCLHFSWLLSASPLSALTLPEVLAQVQSQHPALAAANARIEAARAAWVQAGRWRNPELELRAENLRASPPLSRAQPSLDFFATLTQVLEVAGKPGLRRLVAAAEREQAEANRARVKLDLALAALGVYFTALRSHLEVTMLARTHEQLRHLAQLAERRVLEGRSPAAEAAKLGAELARFDERRSELALDEERALEGLQLLLGRGERVRGDELREPPLPLPPAGELEPLIARALQQHPDYKLAMANCARTRGQLALERAKQVPDPALTAGYKRTESTDTWVGGLTIPLPLLDTNRANVERAIAEHQAAEAALSALERELRSSITGVLLSARALHDRAQRLPAQLLEPAKAALTAARAAFTEGTGDLLALVDAERVAAEAERTLVQTRTEAAAALYTWAILAGEPIAPLAKEREP